MRAREGTLLSFLTFNTDVSERHGCYIMPYMLVDIYIYSRDRSRRVDQGRLWWTFRGRMDRWKLEQSHAGHAYRRAITRFKFLKGKMKPAFIVAFFKLLMNAWNTCERFRSASNRFAYKKCPFCGIGKDSIEHFSSCHVVKLGYRQHNWSRNCLHDFFALDQASFDIPQVFLRKVKIIGALYTVHSTVTACSVKLDIPRLLKCAISSAL